MISVSIFIMMVDSREMLMRRSICFPGISPKVEFATMSVIEECDGKDIQPQPASPVSVCPLLTALITPSVSMFIMNCVQLRDLNDTQTAIVKRKELRVSHFQTRQ